MSFRDGACRRGMSVVPTTLVPWHLRVAADGSRSMKKILFRRLLVPVRAVVLPDLSA